MKYANILAAEKEAERFLEMVQRYRDRHAADSRFAMYCEMCAYKECGAVRRSSMDLTRALAEMRKP